MWFLLRGDDSILVYSQPGKAKLRNMDGTPERFAEAFSEAIVITPTRLHA